MKRSAQEGESASDLIDAKIAGLGDWRGETLARLRALIRQADPEIVEEWKWGTPVWSREGIVCTGETYKSHVKLTFAKGAALPDPAGVFNASLEGNVRRGVDVAEGAQVNGPALQALVRAAVALNTSGKKAPAKKAPAKKATVKKATVKKATVKKATAKKATAKKAPAKKATAKKAPAKKAR